MKRVSYVLLALLTALPFVASAFELRLSEPELNLSVPGVPPAELHELAGQSASANRTLIGVVSDLSIQVELLAQPNQVSPRVCAGSLLRVLLAQPGMPNRDSIYRAPLDEYTFLVIYALGDGRAPQLHAHIISAAGSAHCANAHFVRPASPGEDIDTWRTTFTSARVVPR